MKFTFSVKSISCALNFSAFNFWLVKKSINCLLFIWLAQYSTTANSGFSIFIYSNISQETSVPSDETGQLVGQNRIFLKSNPNFPHRFNLPDGIYTFSTEVTEYIRYSTYNEFRNFLMRLRAIRGHYSESGERFAEIQKRLKKRFGSEDFYPATATALSIEFGGVLPNIRSGATNVMSHAPFDDLIDFVDSDGVLGPEACLRLHKDFLDYKELAYASGSDSFLIEIFDFFLHGLTNAISCGNVVIRFTP